MNKTKKILPLFSIPLLALLLSGCGTQKSTPQAPVSQKSVTETASAPATPAPQATEQSQNQAAAATAKQKTTLTALPADDKAAVDSELSNIDKELKTADDSTNQNDLSDAQLGL